MDINDEFIEQYGNLIRDTIWKTGIRDTDEYDAVYNDVIIRIMGYNNYDPEKGGITNWLFLVTRSVLGNHFKHKTIDATHNALPLLEELTPEYMQSQDPADNEDFVDIINKIDDLSETERKALIAYYHYGYTAREVGEQLGLTDTAVWKILERARIKLTAQVQGEFNV